ncbi:FAD-binding protein [Bengtsoniella intestinalis]|uniref:FAD-binding protein n=1 Tax=Bengtsoniella intestinalis TaxID=3073143 RepID=UPI00391F99DE
MAELRIDPQRCRGCGLCTEGCATGALSMADKVAVVNDNCVFCGVCVQNCPFEAISIAQDRQIVNDVTAYQNVWVFTQINQGEIAPVSLELLGIGATLAQEKRCQLVAVVLEETGADYAQTLIAHGADRVLLCQEAALTVYNQDRCATILGDMIGQYKPEILLFGATGFGRALAPSVAALVKTGLTADCTVLAVDGETGLLRQTRPAFGGNLMATIVCPDCRPQMATVRPGVMAKCAPDTARVGAVEVFVPTVAAGVSKVTVLETTLRQTANAITGAEKLVVVGRGIGGKKNMKLVYEFAEKIGAQVAVSRPLVDMGYAPYAQQVGQTGCTVAPKLLISLGVSGAIQHKAGISRAEQIIAINTDEEAPIFAISQYKIVADCVEILKGFV